MDFIRRNKYPLLFAAVLLLSSIMVLREITEAGSAHVQRREDFLYLSEKGRPEQVQTSYQVLIQELPNLSDQLLSEDLQRTGMLLDPAKPDSDSLVWKYNVSVKNELRKRVERRVLAKSRESGEK